MPESQNGDDNLESQSSGFLTTEILEELTQMMELITPHVSYTTRFKEELIIALLRNTHILRTPGTLLIEEFFFKLFLSPEAHSHYTKLDQLLTEQIRQELFKLN